MCRKYRHCCYDFGTGYASLAYLPRFRVGGIKIDREFVAGLPDSEQSVALARGILTMASHLGLHGVAEGVETERQAAFCGSMAAPAYARPLPAEQCRWRAGARCRSTCSCRCTAEPGTP
ncbi:EAL domain-containing protein [Pseudomonas lopnurensis]|uniref:EAL domain-containing protein n=1 Tax=Pseudomonas lopnurensis TaxID=1477517 RepID=UPI0035E4191C